MTTALLVFLFCILFILVYPIPILVRVEFNGKRSIRFKIYGFIPVRINLKKEKTGPAPEKQEHEPKPKKKSRFNLRRAVDLVFDKDFRIKARGALKRLLKRMFFSFRIRITAGHLKYGAENPAETGIWLGRYYALRASLYFIDISDNFTLEPDFVNKGVSGVVDGRVRVHLGKILLSSLLFLVDWPVWKTVSMFRGKK